MCFVVVDLLFHLRFRILMVNCEIVKCFDGFIAQEQANVRYKLTRQRFKAATVFVDHYSRLSYVHVHTSTGGDEAVQAKEAFEAYAAQRGVYVKHYQHSASPLS